MAENLKWWQEITPLTLQFERIAVQTSLNLENIAGEYGDKGLEKRLEEQHKSGNDLIAGMASKMKGITTAIVSNSISVESAYEMAGGDLEMVGTWVTTGGGNVCIGCSGLHGSTMTLREFDETQGTNECGYRCYCFWLPGKLDVEGARIKMNEIAADHPEYFKLDRELDIEDFKK